MFKTIAPILAGIALGLSIAALIMVQQSCASAKRYPATSSIGYVISVDGDEVLVSFEVVTLEPGSQAAHWFYIPGHRYTKGDKYPDPAKDSSISSPAGEVGRGVKQKLP